MSDRPAIEWPTFTLIVACHGLWWLGVGWLSALWLPLGVAATAIAPG